MITSIVYIRVKTYTNMKKLDPMSFLKIPTVDLYPFFSADENGKRSAIDKIGQACSELGFFQIINHGVCLDLMNQALKHAKDFFESPIEEKLKSSPKADSPTPSGYNRKLKPEYEFSEYFLMFPPGSKSNVFPTNHPKLREVMEQLFSQFLKIASIIEDILSECLGLPKGGLKEFNDDRSFDLLIALFYLPAKEKEKIGVNSHKDATCFTIVLQDDVGGLEVEKDGQWLPLPPTPGAFVVNIGDVLQVLTNDKFKGPSHRVLRPKGRSRNSFAFFHDLPGEKWLEPLPEFTRAIGEKPKYRKFLFKEYQHLRRKNKANPPSKPEDEIAISYYAINVNETNSIE